MIYTTLQQFTSEIYKNRKQIGIGKQGMNRHLKQQDYIPEICFKLRLLEIL